MTFLKEIANEVTHYEEPKDFINNIEKHKNDIISAIWSGTDLRKRKALIPGVF